MKSSNTKCMMFDIVNTREIKHANILEMFLIQSYLYDKKENFPALSLLNSFFIYF